MLLDSSCSESAAPEILNPNSTMLAAFRITLSRMISSRLVRGLALASAILSNSSLTAFRCSSKPRNAMTPSEMAAPTGENAACINTPRPGTTSLSAWNARCIPSKCPVCFSATVLASFVTSEVLVCAWVSAFCSGVSSLSLILLDSSAWFVCCDAATRELASPVILISTSPSLPIGHSFQDPLEDCTGGLNRCLCRLGGGFYHAGSPTPYEPFCKP